MPSTQRSHRAKDKRGAIKASGHGGKIDIELDRTVNGLVSFLCVSADAPVDTPAKAPAQKLLEELFRRARSP